MNFRLALLTASVSLLSIAAAHAQNGSVIALDPVVVNAASDNAGGETGSTAEGGASSTEGGANDPAAPGGFTVTSEEIARENPTDLQELFQNEPTVTVGGSIPASQKIYVQGVEEPNLAVTIDGVRQNNKTFHHNATTIIDPELLKAVRVDPGVAPADAGPGALGGAIAFETKDARDLLAPGRNTGAILNGQYKSNGDIFSTSATAFGQYGGFDALVFGKFATGDEQTDGNGDTIIGSGTNLLSGLAKAAYQSEAGHRIEAAFEVVNDDEPRPYRANIGEIIGGQPVPPTRDYTLNRQNYSLTYTDETPSALWDPKVQIGFSSTDLDVTEPGQGIYGVTQSFNGKAQNTFSGGYGSITLGTDFYADEADYDYRSDTTPSWNEFGTERAQNIGFYGQGRFDITDRLRLSGGGRLDVQRFEGVDGSEQVNAGPSVNVSGEFDITSFLTAYAGVSHVWAGIPLAENFIINPFWTYGNDITPTTADNVVAGLRASHNGFSAGAKVFQTQIYDARTPSYSLGPDIQRDVRTRGYELTAGYDNAAISANVGYAFIDADIDGRPADSYVGNYLTVPVGHILTASAAYTFAQWNLTVGANAEVALENTDTYDDDTGKRGEPLPGYEVVNAFAEWNPARLTNLTLRAEVNNVFDAAYVSRGTYGTEYAGVVPLYEPGRSFLLKASVRF